MSAVLKKELDYEESVKSLTVLYCFPGTIAFSPLEKAFCPFKFIYYLTLRKETGNTFKLLICTI